MVSDNWWTSAEGREYRDQWRQITTARGGVAVRPRAKGARGAQRERELILAAARAWHQAHRGGWPRPKAEVALDLWAVTENNPPQPQNFAKRLLDQLGDVDGKPIIYTDDRQVSMLFVRIDEVDGDRIPPTIFFAAQRSSLVREAIRYARERRDEYEDSNRDFDREMDWQQRLDEADDAVDTWRNDSSEFGRRWYARALYDRQFLIQCNALAAADNLAAHVVSSYAGRRPRDPQAFVNLDASMIDLLSTMPYAMNLGPLPAESGETERFLNNLRAVLSARIAAYPMLYPLLCSVGVTVFFFPGPQGKDLDNIFRLVVPVLLEQLHPPSLAKGGYALRDEEFALWDAVRRGQTAPASSRIAFIEAVALKGMPYPPGTVLITLSDGERRKSWWQLAIDD